VAGNASLKTAQGARSSLFVGRRSTGTAVTNGLESYSYDDHDRLISASYPGGGTALYYQYDANGNRTEVTSGTTSTDYTYDDADQLIELHDDATGTPISSFDYDAKGNRVAATSGSATDTYVYDWRNRLTSATVGGSTVNYEYSGDDLRTERSVVGGTTETLLWDRQAGLPELVDDGSNIYLQFGDGELAEIGASGAATYPLADALGSSRATTDDSGAVVGTADWDVWGNSRSSTGAQAGMGWTGELQDDATGLTYLRARDYSPGGGRFLQRDTVSPNGPGSQGYNPYAYAAGNPATHLDPSGHSTGDYASGLIVGILDPSSFIMPIVMALRPIRALMRMINDLPPIIRPLVTAIINFVMAVLINLVVTLIFSWAIAVIGQIVKGSMVGSALAISRFMSTFSKAGKIFQECTQPGELGYACRHLDEIYPELPNLLSNPCVKSFLREMGDALADGFDGALDAAQVVIGWATDACFNLKLQVFPHTDRLPMINSLLMKFKPGTKIDITSGGGLRDRRRFFRMLRDDPDFGEALSPVNRGRIARGDAPIVDDQWIEFFPDHAQFKDDILVHHHIACGFAAIALPEKLHLGNSKSLHENCP
jgi:RHS repeat-associated protein